LLIAKAGLLRFDAFRRFFHSFSVFVALARLGRTAGTARIMALACAVPEAGAPGHILDGLN